MRRVELLRRTLRTVVARPRTVLAIAVVAAALSIGLAVGRLDLRTSNLDLIDAGLPAVSDFRSFAFEFGTPNVLVIVLEGERPEDLRAAVDRIGPGLRGLSGVEGVLDRLPFDEEELPGVDPYFVSRDGGLFFVFVRPDDPYSRASTLEPFVRGVQQFLDQAGLDESGVRAGLTGMPKYALDDRDGVQRDLSRLSGVSFALVLALFAFAFRGLRRPLLAMISLLIAVAVTLGVVSFYPGHLTLLSAFFATILFGLGIDYGIHLIARVEELVLQGESEAAAAIAAGRATGRALTAGALTTCSVFFAMVFSGFRGFAELGLVAGVGVVICLGVTLTLLPALLTLFPGRPRAASDTVRPPRVSSLLPRLAHPAAAIAVAIVAIGGLLFAVPEFDRDYLALQAVDSNAVRLEREMVRRSDLSPVFAAFTVPTQAAALELEQRLAAEPTVGRVHSIGALQLLALALGRPVPAELEQGLVGRSGKFAVYAYPAEDIWSRSAADGFVERMRSIDPRVTGMPILGEFMVERSRRALTISGAIGGLALLACLLADFRHPVLALVAAIPALATLPLMFVGMALFGIEFNPLNVMALPVVLGIAVDDGIHIVHRYLDEGGQIRPAMLGTGRAVVLTSLTTLAAFGTLALATHRGLASFGAVVALGVTAALALSVVLLPVVLRISGRRLAELVAVLGLGLALFGATPVAQAACDAAEWELRGDQAWSVRDRGMAERGVPDAEPVREALESYAIAVSIRPADPLLHIKWIEAIYFESEFVDPRPETRRAAHEKMVYLCAETVALVAERAGCDAECQQQPVELVAASLRVVPGAEEAQLWSAVSWGLWAMSHGNLQAAATDAAGRIRDHATLLDALDPSYADGAGLRILGRLHSATPRVPFFTGWVRRREGLAYLRQANAISVTDPRNPLFLAEALWRSGPEHREEARSLLAELVRRSPRPDRVVEDTALLDEARVLLEEFQSR